MFPIAGGAVEPDEDPAAAVARKAREELHRGNLQGLIGVYGGPQFRVCCPNGDLVSYVAIVYACSAAGTPAAPDPSDVDEVRFVAQLDGLPAARWLPSVHVDAVGWQQRSVAAPSAQTDLRQEYLAVLVARFAGR